MSPLFLISRDLAIPQELAPSPPGEVAATSQGLSLGRSR